MLDIIEHEKKLLDAIVLHVPSFNDQNVILLPTNAAELDKPYLGISSLDLSSVGRPINHAIDEVTGEREVTQHYEWKVRFTAIGQNDPDKNLTVSSLGLIQGLILIMSTKIFRDELECESIHLRRVNRLIRMPQLIETEWVDQTTVDVYFGLADITTEFISFIEQVEISNGELLRAPDDPNPIDSTP